MTEIWDACASLGSDGYATNTVAEQLREMDANAIARAAVSPFGAELALRNREGNQRIAGAVRAHPDRFIGFGSVNPWWGERAVDEVKRIATEFEFPGLFVHPVIQGFQLSDDIIRPVLESAIDNRLVVYVHTGTPVLALPLQLLELATEYKECRFIAGHMGGDDFYVDIPFSFDRVDNVWFETSLSPHIAYADEVIERLGAERVVFGSAAPISRMASELYKVGMLNLNSDARDMVLGGNFQQLLSGRI